MASLMSDQLMETYSRHFDTLHAGAVAVGDCGILIPGESHAGKSTTSAIFAMAGLRFYTDDVAIFDEDMRLVPHPRAVMLRSGGWYRLSESFPEKVGDRLVWGSEDSATWYVDAFGPSEGGQTIEHPTIKLILLPTRDQQAPLITPISRGDVIPVLVSQCFGMASDPIRSLETIIPLARGADCYSISMLDPEKAVAAVTKLAQAM